MLVLRRKAGESIVLAGTIYVTVLVIEGKRVKIGVSAPPDVSIVREELAGTAPSTLPPQAPENKAW